MLRMTNKQNLYGEINFYLIYDIINALENCFVIIDYKKLGRYFHIRMSIINFQRETMKHKSEFQFNNTREADRT